MPIIRRFARAAFAALLLAVTACGGSSPGSVSTPSSPTPPAVATPPPVATTTVDYSGIFGAGTFTGTVTLSAAVPVSAARAQVSTVRPLAIAAATGTARFSGQTQVTTTLTGTYDTATNRFALRSGGFSVDAAVAGDTVTGTIATPAGAGSVAALRSTDDHQPARFCGIFAGTESGKFLIVIRGSSASGVAAQDGEHGSITLAGSAGGNRVTLTWSWTDGAGGRGTANGTINGDIVAGTWTNTDGQGGTWSARGC